MILCHKIKNIDLLACVIDSVQKRYFDNCLKNNIHKSEIISFTLKTNNIKFNYKFCNRLVSEIKNLGIFSGYQLCFHSHVHYIFTLICNIRFYFLTIDRFSVLFNAELSLNQKRFLSSGVPSHSLIPKHSELREFILAFTISDILLAFVIVNTMTQACNQIESFRMLMQAAIPPCPFSDECA